MTFEDLRKKHPEFIYHGFEKKFEDQTLKIYFDFEISPNIKFRPEIILPNVFPHRMWEGKLDNLVFNLGMVELISYWKATCSPKITIKAGFLDQEQIKFWKKLLIKGLGEFFYTNRIDFTQDGLVNFEVRSHMSSGKPFEGILKDRDLILVGGGKDSVVTLDSISKSGKEFNCLLLNPTDAAIKIAEIGGCKNPIIVKRTIDPKLLELNEQGYLNGHTPFSAYLAFLSMLSSVIYDYKNVVVSNESSSNEGNVIWMGKEINHQYSKSEEFEKDFKEYSQKYLAPVNYYSYLRELNELEIARIFSNLEKYHKVFRSCNKGSKQGSWCGKCSKCLFTNLILYPFLGKKIERIFGKDLLDDETLSPVMEELLHLPGKFKPFECVGTKEEIEYAMLLGILRSKRKLLERYKDQISILILGMGREGIATSNFLQKNNINFSTSDQKEGKNYLDKLKDYDVIIKSPGIPYLIEIKKAKENGKIISSSTQIFFDLCLGKIIGVTGTKGKSTTTSMIYEVLKSGGLDVYLVGNIGQPALDLLDNLKKDSIVVYELSSFQLADLKKSPQIAVITNIYPDHLDWHGSFEDYKKAKENISRFQTKNDILISNKRGAEAAKIIGKLFKISEEKINKAIKNFKPLPHRLEFVAEKNGIKFYNDSLATNPHATIFGLKTLGEKVETLIAGGLDRGVDYSILGPVIANSKIKNLILFPDTGKKIGEVVSYQPASLRGESSAIRQFHVNNMEEAVKIAYENTSPGKICLMSPASASFNMFKDYEDRGNQFRSWVARLGRRH
ncbi:UDP-N-acetylmuramoyl-L-alanine--D-glutamate ligase [Candidatus Daviesbacteria bacterium]|nr:UDP-N-acetylmuramoyl-L-alanine--D-glutamate ligase [Candidatus Daviesbacteria bacterium]